MVNLSLDENFRSAVLKKGILNKTVELFGNITSKPSQQLIQQVLYLLSVDEKSKPLFAYTECVPLIVKLILESKSEKVSPELIALGINLATEKKNAEIFCFENGVKFLMKRAFKTKDSLIFKLLRNVSHHDGEIKMPFLDFIDDIMHLLFKSLQIPELCVELIGILGNLSILEFDFAKLSEAYKLDEFISNFLQKSVKNLKQKEPGGGGLADDDDITLEIIVLLGTMAADDGMAPIIARSNIIQSLLELMMGKEEDDEIILQITFCIYNMLLHEETRNMLISKTQIVAYLIDLLYDRNIEIRKMCDACLDIIIEIDESWVKKIKLQKFQWHNAEWLASMSEATSQQAIEDDHPGSYEESALLYSNKKLTKTNRFIMDEIQSDEDDDDLYRSMLTTNQLVDFS
ncbi:Kinesin-associated protein 3 [Clydaea vesicula]|uniref:Kinesin-associated protein 3 n=1 Tax=Clydaea vesicula TaxID=447962 RepID=A0AAD5TT77_9FUNG|nr:Kinesin-associated protein 3 [Clydaea vesicula]